MKRFLEDMGVAAGLAQEGDQAQACAIIEELKRLREEPGCRIVLVQEASTMPLRVARYVSRLARRIGANLLVVAPGNENEGAADRNTHLECLQKEADGLHITSFFSSGDCLELARSICDQVRGVELILVHAPDTAKKALCLHRQFKVPVYQIG